MTGSRRPPRGASGSVTPGGAARAGRAASEPTCRSTTAGSSCLPPPPLRPVQRRPAGAGRGRHGGGSRGLRRRSPSAAELRVEILELDFAHGYLPASFLSPLGNRRTDAYGENRLRFPLDVLDAVRRAWEGVLAVRLSITDWAPGGLSVDEGRCTRTARRARMRPHTVAGQTVAEERRSPPSVPDRAPATGSAPGPACRRRRPSRRSTTRTRSSAPAGATSASSICRPSTSSASSADPAREERHHPVMSDLGELTYPNLEELLEHGLRTVAVLPLGATEPHGPHAPLETDTLISLGICTRGRAARGRSRDPRARSAVASTGVTRYGAGFPAPFRSARRRSARSSSRSRGPRRAGPRTDRARQQPLRARAGAHPTGSSRRAGADRVSSTSPGDGTPSG